MKMRKKLAALLAAAMIASVMPMTAFAESANRVTQIVQVVEDGKTDKPVLEIKMKDKLKEGDTFYVKLENAKWDAPTLTTDSALIVDNTVEKEIAVKAKRDIEKDETIGINIKAKDIKKDEAVVIVDGWDTTVTSSKHTFARVGNAKATVTVKEDVPSFYAEKSKIAKFTIEEAAAGEFKKNPKLTFTLDNDDFEFTDNAKVTYTKGLDGSDEPVVKVADKDKQVVTLDFTGKLVDSSTRGVVEIELEVQSTTRRPSVGDLNVEISGKLVDDKEYKVATIAEYGIELKADKEDYEFLAGRQEKVVFHLNEIVDDSLVSGRITEFSLPEGVYFNTVSLEKGDKIGNIEYVKNDDKQITGFTVELKANRDKVDKFKFEAKLDITSDFEGDIVLKAEGRSIGEDLEATIAKVKPAVKVSVEPMTVKVGLKEQVGGKIVIEELEKGALLQGKEIVVSLENEKGISIKDADVEVVKGDLKKGDIDVAKTTEGAITIKVTRKSKEASVIELTNIKVKLDRTVPEGAYEIKVGGPAISDIASADGKGIYGYDNITAKDFLFVGERYTRAEVKFVIGSSKFLVNGKEMTMDAAAYIKDGRTMVPLRYLSYALGVDQESIKFNSGIVTIFAADGKVIQVQSGNKNLTVNGMTIPMVAAAEIIEGRTYVPVTEIGGVFGVTGTWDAVTQTATFK